LSRPELDRAYGRFIEIADQKKEIFDEDLIAIVHDGMREIPETFALKVLQATAGSQRPSTATVTLEVEGRDEVACAIGDGPVAAAYNAIDQITRIRGRLLDYSIRAVSRGRDAMGEVSVHVEFGGRAFTGKAASTDVVDASARAYLHAVNKALHLSRSLAPSSETVVAAALPRIADAPIAPRGQGPAAPSPASAAAGELRQTGGRQASDTFVRLINLV
ncbi:MAG TPA: alpha-isopropylmalate synthase regulatory domain-containing protein, partial [Candidatus Polarisedimenticolia bacterium]|nr:alpha-isopropylmalate synthase regulatory domain-containing protein [Candidatus Polarisedimenticolia bacterium]